MPQEQHIKEEGSSIRTEIVVGEPGFCPVAEASSETGNQVYDVERSVKSGDKDRVTEEFSLDGLRSPPNPDIRKVFGYNSHSVYRFSRDRARSCVCDSIEVFDCPVSNVSAEDGMLFITFYAPSIDKIKEIMDDLDQRFSDVHLRELTQPDEESVENLVFMDRNRLTERQNEVLRTAYDMGYFDHPKKANASEVAAELDIALSTFTEHLSAAQTKILQTLLEP